MSVTKRLDRRSRVARAQGRQAREQLLSAALRVFARRGYGQAGVDEIAADAGYSKGALYWHFSSKEDLLLTLLDERVDAPLRRNIERLASAPPSEDMSVEAAGQFARQLAEDREALILDREYWSMAIREPELRARYAERQVAIRRAFAQALVARARHLGTPELSTSAEDVARIVLSVIDGLIGAELMEPCSVRPDLLSEALALIYAGLVARG